VVLQPLAEQRVELVGLLHQEKMARVAKYLDVHIRQPAILPSDGDQKRPNAELRRVPLYSPGQLLIEGKPIFVMGTISPQSSPTTRIIGKTSAEKDAAGQAGGGYGGNTDLVLLCHKSWLCS
jgi:hypothetical protein